MATNTDEKAKEFAARWIKLEEERLENATDRKELVVEMKSAGLLAEEIAGIKLYGKRHFEPSDKRIKRESAEEFAASLGSLASTPLGEAAVRSVRRAA